MGNHETTANQYCEGKTFLDSARSLLLLAVVSCFGCSDPNAGVVTDMREDFEHEHKHQHSDHDDHEHTHADDIQGTHSHQHTHGHRHGEPLFGGRLISIGHAHHADGATHFHAEVMPLRDDTIRIHVLTDSDSGGLEALPIMATELTALVGVKDQESMSSECSFKAVGDEQPASEFLLVIPESIADATSYSVVVPKIEIDGQRQNFSFQVRRSQDDHEPAADTDRSADSNE